METRMDKICSECRVHTIQYIEPLENGRYKLRCCECGCSITYDKDGLMVPREQILREKEEWA